MGSDTLIGWSDFTLNAMTSRCKHVAPECWVCYAEKLTNRWEGPGAFQSEAPVLKPGRLLLPWLDAKMRAHRRGFLVSMSDPFHPALSVEDQAQVWAMMACDRGHEWQVLTKRPEVMRKLLTRPDFSGMVRDLMPEFLKRLTPRRLTPARRAILEGVEAAIAAFTWPLPNVLLGVSAGLQETAEKFIPTLLRTPAAHRFVSVEPLIGRADLRLIADPSPRQPQMVLDVVGRRYGVPGRWQEPTAVGLDWVIVGGESGKVYRPDPWHPPMDEHGRPSGYARPMDLEWMRTVMGQCTTAGVPVFAKQLGSVQAHVLGLGDFKGEEWSQWPAGLEDLRLRQFPDVPVMLGA